MTWNDYYLGGGRKGCGVSGRLRSGRPIDLGEVSFEYAERKDEEIIR